MTFLPLKVLDKLTAGECFILEAYKNTSAKFAFTPFFIFFPPGCSFSHPGAGILGGTIWENIRKELWKIISLLFAPEICLSIILILSAHFYLLATCSFHCVSLSLSHLPSAFMWSPGPRASFPSSAVLVLKHTPCSREKQHIKATRPKLGHVKVLVFTFCLVFFLFVTCVSVLAAYFLFSSERTEIGGLCP